MQVSKEEILHIANLAKLNLKEEEIELYRKNLDEILNYAEIVNNAPIQKLTGMIGINDSFNVFRKDEMIECMPREELLKNAPEQQEGMFKIPKVMN